MVVKALRAAAYVLQVGSRGLAAVADELELRTIAKGRHDDEELPPEVEPAPPTPRSPIGQQVWVGETKPEPEALAAALRAELSVPIGPFVLAPPSDGERARAIAQHEARIARGV